MNIDFNNLPKIDSEVWIVAECFDKCKLPSTESYYICVEKAKCNAIILKSNEIVISVSKEKYEYENYQYGTEIFTNKDDALKKAREIALSKIDIEIEEDNKRDDKD